MNFHQVIAIRAVLVIGLALIVFAIKATPWTDEDNLCLLVRKYLNENNPHEAWKTFVYLDSTSKTNHGVYPLDVLDELAKAFLNMGQQYQGFMNHIWALRLKRINEFGSPNEKFYAQAGLLRYLRNNHRLEEAGELVKSIKDWSSKYLPPESIHLILYQEGMIFHDKGLFDQAKKIFKEGLKGKNSFKNYYYEAYASCLQNKEESFERDSIFKFILSSLPMNRRFWYLYNWGTCENNLNNLVLADSLFCQAEQKTSDIQPNDHAYLMNKLASVNLKIGDYKQALLYNTLGLKILQPNISISSIWEVPNNLDINLKHSHLIDLLGFRANLYLNIYLQYKTPWVDKEINKLYNHLGSLAILKLFEQDALSAQLLWQDYLVNYYNSVFFRFFYVKGDYQKLWSISELSRAVATNIQLTKKVSIYPPVSLNKFKELILAQNKVSDLDTSDHYFWRLPLQADSFIFKKLETVELKTIQINLASENQTLLEYVWLPNDTGLYLLKLNSRDFKVYNLTAHIPEIKEIITYAHKLVNFTDSVSFDVRRHNKLYDLLLKPAWPLTEHLIIIPMGLLNSLSFATLSQNKNNEQRFLVQDHTLSYQLSATLWSHQNHFKTGNSGLTTLSFAPDYSMPYSSLAYNREETKLVRLLNPKKELTFEGAAAQVSTYLNHAGQASLIHIAAHAEIDEGNYLNGRIIFNQNASPSSLDFQTILGTPIRAQLVVLSGCKTASGNLRVGEGMVSLVNAFTAAGAQSVLSTFWPIYDQISLNIMRDFYTGLERGNTLDEALAKAQRNFISSAQADQINPYFWGGFGVWGNHNLSL